MSVEGSGEMLRICPKRVREDIVRGIAAANGAAGAEQIDVTCPADCPRNARSKVLGIPMPLFIGRCQMETQAAPAQGSQENRLFTGPFHPL